MRKREREKERKRERERERTKSANETNVISTSDDDASRIFVASCRERNKKRSVTPPLRIRSNTRSLVEKITQYVASSASSSSFCCCSSSLRKKWFSRAQRRTPNCTKSPNDDDANACAKTAARLFPASSFRFCLCLLGASASGDVGR